MSDVESNYEDFIASGRAGRRNALHDILNSPESTDTSELAQKLSELEINKAEATGDAQTNPTEQATASQDEAGKQNS